jgi:transcriptional regulator with XRE-family HTH domain
MTAATQREQLSQFLKNCRARLSPSDVGLPDPDRRRTPGLRREDVAALTGVSVTWYTWLEQGRDVQVSANVLERISRTLELSADERDYLFSLVQHRPPPLVPGRAEDVNPAVQRMLDTLQIPALVMTIRWDVVAWNDMLRRAVRDYAAMPADQRNLLKLLFTHPEYKIDPAEYEAMVRRVLAKLRVDYSQSAPDPCFDKLISELNEICPVFRRLWKSPEVIGRSEGINVVRHPKLGGITFEHTSYVPEGSPTLRVVIFVPHDAGSAAKVAQLASQNRARSSRAH